MSSKSASTTGVAVGKKWKAGKKIGSGACAVVYDLVTTDGRSTDYVVKMTPVPKKKTKNGKTKEEIDASLLHYEQLIYQTQFQSLQGKTIPSIPFAGPPITGESGGYKFFVMQKMESTITGVVSLLLSGSAASKKTIKFGTIAAQMLECLQSVHETNNVVRDVKTENFMIAPPKPSKGGRNSAATALEKSLASRVRMIDLALVSQWTPSYRETTESNDIIGTPLYSSLNVHNGQKASFRDDLEALGYIIAELIHQLVSGDDKKQLPWASGSSDDEIGMIKKEQLRNRKSDFYGDMGDRKTADIMSQFFTEVQSYTFKKRPQYEKLTRIVAKLETVRPAKASTKTTSRSSRATTPTKTKATAKRGRSKAPPAAAVASPSARRRKYSGDDEEEDSEDPMDWDYTDENCEPPSNSDGKQDSKKMSSRAQRAARRNADVIVIDDDSDEEMDVKPAATNTSKKKGASKAKQPTSSRASATTSSASGLGTVGVIVEVVQGPHAGEGFELTSGDCEAVVLGSCPPKGTLTGIVLDKDKSLQPVHLKLELSVTRKKIVSVAITDKSKGDTSINGQTVKASKAFANDRISIGETVLRIKRA